MKNADLKLRIRQNGLEWDELSRELRIPMKDLVRRLNKKEISPLFRRRILEAIDHLSQRSEFFYDEFR